jgi:hypothetical protein
MTVHKLPQTQKEMDLFLDDVFRTVFQRQYEREQMQQQMQQQKALELKGGKVQLKAVVAPVVQPAGGTSTDQRASSAAVLRTNER